MPPSDPPGPCGGLASGTNHWGGGGGARGGGVHVHLESNGTEKPDL